MFICKSTENDDYMYNVYNIKFQGSHMASVVLLCLMNDYVSIINVIIYIHIKYTLNFAHKTT